MGHAVKLVKKELIELDEIFSAEKIAALAKALNGYEEESLAPLKDRNSDEFSWDELKLYRSSTLKKDFQSKFLRFALCF